MDPTTHYYNTGEPLQKEEQSYNKPHNIKRQPAETQRLQDLKVELDNLRKFVVTRQVILTTASQEKDRYGVVDVELPGGKVMPKKVLIRKGIPRQFEIVHFEVWATNGPDAAQLGDQAKFNRERERGHHKNVRTES